MVSTTVAPSAAASTLRGSEAVTSLGARLVKDDLPLQTIDKAFRASTEVGCKSRCSVGLFALGQDAYGAPISCVLSTHLAGAVYRLAYGGVDFVVPVAIVGASLQWSLSLDIRSGHNEQYNPTEAGCGTCDSFTGKSSSRLLEFRAAGTSAAYTRVQPAYFRAPGTFLRNKASGRMDVPVLNKTLLSDTLIEKRLEFTAPGVLDMVAAITIPGGKHYFSLPNLACWTPPAACAHKLVLVSGAWQKATNTLYFVQRGAQGIVMATADGQRAMGVKLLEYPRGDPLFTSPGYNFNTTPKWTQWTVRQAIGSRDNYSRHIPRGPYGYRIRFFFGNLERVKALVAAAAS